MLAAVLTVLMLLRARLFRHRAQVAAPLVGVAVILVAAMARSSPRAGRARSSASAWCRRSRWRSAAWRARSAVRSGRRPLSPRLSRGLDVLETLLLLAVVPLALAVWDVYTRLLEIRA